MSCVTMVAMRLVVLGFVSVLVLAACGQGTESPTPSPTPTTEACRGTFTWHYGSTPPPTSDNWTLTLHGDGTADYTHEASHVDEVVYEDKGFDVDPAAAQRICEAAASVPEDSDPLVGGRYVHWKLSGSSGGTTHLDDDAAGALLSAAREAVGQARLDAGRDAFEQWQTTYGG